MVEESGLRTEKASARPEGVGEVNRFEDLIARQKDRELPKVIYRLTGTGPQRSDLFCQFSVLNIQSCQRHSEGGSLVP